MAEKHFPILSRSSRCTSHILQLGKGLGLFHAVVFHGPCCCLFCSLVCLVPKAEMVFSRVFLFSEYCIAKSLEPFSFHLGPEGSGRSCTLCKITYIVTVIRSLF